MKEQNVLNVLMYLFKYHMQPNAELDTNEEELVPHLEEIGFKRHIIAQAFSWLANLVRNQLQLMDTPQDDSLRIFSEYECELIDPVSRGFILELTQLGVLTPINREIVIIQVIELAAEGIDINLIKWVALMVLFSQPGQESALAYLEFLVLSEDYLSERMH